MTQPRLDLSQNMVEKREDRLGTVKAYHGSAQELLESNGRCGKPLEWKNRTFQQASMCLLTQTVGRLVTIRDSVLIIHGPVGCSAGATGYREIYQSIPRELGRPDFELHILSSNLTEQDIVFGGENKLRQAILDAVERYNPKSIIIATTCATGIMGDDIEGVVDSLKSEVDAVLVPIHCEGFRSQISQTAFDASAHAIVKYLVKPPRKVQKDLVNIIAPFSVSWSDRMEVTRLFDKIGLRPQFIPDFASTEELQQISEAAVTAPSCPSYGLYLQQALQQQYNVPYFRDPAPWGIDNSIRWFREIGKYTGKEKEVEALIEEELAIVLPQVEELKAQFKGLNASILVSAGQARAAFIPLFAAELGIKVAAVNTLELDTHVLEELEKTYDKIGDFEVHASDSQPFEQSHLLNRLKPELYSGCPFMGLYKRQGSNVRNHSYRSDFSQQANQILFRGVVNYGYVMQRSLNNPSLCKTLEKNTPSVYKEWWYKQSDILAYAK